MGRRLSQTLTMVLSLYLVAFNLSEAKTIQKRMFSTGNPFTLGGLRNAILHRQLQHQEHPSEGVVWPKFMALKEHIRPSRQFHPIVGSSAFIPLGNNLPLEAEHRAVESAPHFNEVDVQSSTESTPELATDVSSNVFKQFTPSLPIPIPLVEYSVPVSQQTSVLASFTPFNGQVSQTAPIPQPTPVQTSLTSIYNTQPAQTSSQSFVPYNPPVQQLNSQSYHEQSSQPVPQPVHTNTEPQSAPASFTPFNIPPPQPQFNYNNQPSQQLPAPLPVPATLDAQSGRAIFAPHNGPVQQHVSQYTPHNAPVQQPQHFAPPVHQPASQYNPHNSPIQQHQPAPQQFIPNQEHHQHFAPPVPQHQPASQYNPHIQQHQPAPQQFSPNHEPVHQSIPQHFAPPIQQFAPQQFIPNHEQPQHFAPPVQQHQPASQYNPHPEQHQPAPQPFIPHHEPVQHAAQPFEAALQQNRATSYNGPIAPPVEQHQESLSPFNAPQLVPFTPYNVPQHQPAPPIPQSSHAVDHAAPVESSRTYGVPETQAFGPPQTTQPFSIFQEMIHQNLVSWPGVDQPSQGRQEPYQPRHDQEAHQQQDRNAYANSRFLNFESPSTQFAKRSIESPPSAFELGFPSIGSFFDNFNNDVDWSNFAGKRKRRSAQRTRSTHDWGNRKVIEDYDNIAVEARQATESRVPAPSTRSVSNPNRGQKQEPKQEYDGPYVYTQLFGPPYEVGYIRSPIPSKHVYEDYLQFVRSWSAASRDAVDDQLRTNPAAAKDYTSVKYTDSAPAYKEPAAAYNEPTPAYKEPSQSYKESSSAYKEVEYKAPPFKGPSQNYKEPAYTEQEYKEPAYKGSAPAYKEPAPAYTESTPAYREPVQSYKEPVVAYTESAPAYKEPSYKESSSAYKEVEYKAPVFKGPSPSYKEPAYTEQLYSKEPEYKEPTSSKGSVAAYREPEYKPVTQAAYTEAAPAYNEPAYKEEPYKEPARTERPVYREEIPYRGETSHKSAYKDESPKINYHSPQSDYVAPETEFRPTNRPYEAVGPKSPVYVERDFIPIKSQAQSYDPPTTTYRTTVGYDAPSKNGYPTAPVAYPPTPAYEPVTAKYKAPEVLYDSPTQSYEQVTTNYKAPGVSYDQVAYEAPKRYVEIPTRDYLPAVKNYENPPSRTPSPSVAYYKPLNRYVEPPQHGTKYEAPAAYEAPAPAKYVEPAYEAPKKYEAAYESPAPAKYVEPAYEAPGKYVEYPPTTHRPDEYRVIPLTTPAYKETYPVDDYASSGYKDDVELSSTSYQAVSKNYDAPNDDYAKPPIAYDQVKKPEVSYSAEKESYPSAPSYDDVKKSEDNYEAGSEAGSSSSYEAPKKKHYPVIIGRYQVTDSSAFLPKKVGGESGSSGGKSVGSQVHGANGEEYVVYYLPYGQPLPIPVRRRRSTENLEQPVYKIRRLKSLADSQRHRRKLRGESLPEEQVLTPEEVHKQQVYAKPVETAKVETVTEVAETLPAVEEEVVVDEIDIKKVEDETVSIQDEIVSPVEAQDDVSPQVDILDEKIVSPQVDQVQDEIISPIDQEKDDDSTQTDSLNGEPVSTLDEVAQDEIVSPVEAQDDVFPQVDILDEKIVSPQVDQVQDEIISPVDQENDQVSPQVSDEKIVSPQVDQVQDEIISSQIDVSQDEIVPAQVEEMVKEDIPVTVEIVQEEPEKIPSEEEDVTTETPVTIDEMMVAKIEEDLTNSAVLPVSIVDPEAPVTAVEEPVGEIIIVKVSAENEDEPVIVAVEEVSVSQVSMTPETEVEADEPQITSDVAEEPQITSDVAEEPQITSDVAEEPEVEEIVTKVETPIEVEEEPVVAVQGGVANIDIITEQEEEVNEPPYTSQVAFNSEKGVQNYPTYPSSAYDGKKKNPAIFKQSVLPGLTQRPVKYLKPPGIATDPKEQFGGYSTWWTKVGSRVAKHYNFEK